MKRWFRRGVVLFLVVLVAVAAGVFFATRHLDLIAEWAVERVFPGVDVKMKSLRATSWSELRVRELEFSSKKTGGTLLRLEDGVVDFEFADLLGWKLEEVRLVNPSLRVAPELGSALGIKPGVTGAETKSGEGVAWNIGRVVIEDGTLTVASFWDRTPTVTMRVSADWKNFGIGGEAGDERQEMVISEMKVRRGDEEPFLRLDRAKVGFTTAGLFTGRRVESLELGSGELRVPENLAAMLPESGDEGETEDQGGWSVGALDLKALEVAVGPAEFVASAKLREVSAGNATDVQRVEVRKVRVVGEDGSPLVVANRGVLEFTIAGLLNREVRLARLGYPRVWLRPEAFSEEQESTGAGAGSGQPASAQRSSPQGETSGSERGNGKEIEWKIGRLVSDYGEVRLSGMGGRIPEMSAKVAFDLRDVGTSKLLRDELHTLVVWDMWAKAEGASSPFLALDLAEVTLSVGGLVDDKVVAGVKIAGGDLTIGQQLKGLLAEGDEGGSPEKVADADRRAWMIGDLVVEGVRTRLEDERVDVTDANFTINSTFKNVAIGAARDGLADEVQTVEFANLVIRSPVNPAAKIVTLRSVFVRFTLEGLANERLREIVILRPTIFLSQDLFVYMEAATASEAGVAEEGESGGGGEGEMVPGWRIEQLEVKFGSLVIGSGGRSDVGLPLEFETLAKNVEFENLAALELQAALRIPEQSYAFESYQLELRRVRGELQFSYPPELGVNNVVQKLEIAGIRWRQYEAGESWLAVTFDALGINGEFGGEAYDGYVNGGFSFFFQTDSPWIGWITGTAVNVGTLTGIASPENFSLTGPADFEVQVDAFAKAIDRVRGKFSLTESGRLRIGKLDDLIENISPDWGSLKQDIARIGLETLRDFEYEDAKGDFWFVQSRGILKLDLSGPNGSRDFEVALHQGADSGGRWQVGGMTPVIGEE